MADHDDASIERDIRERVEASPFHASLGISVESAERGLASTLRFEATPAHANLHGTVHGGVIATLADTAAGLAVRSAMSDPGGAPRERAPRRAVPRPRHAPARCDATGRVVKLGGRLAFAEATVVDDAGEVLARAQVTVALSRPTAPGEPAAQ